MNHLLSLCHAGVAYCSGSESSSYTSAKTYKVTQVSLICSIGACVHAQGIRLYASELIVVGYLVGPGVPLSVGFVSGEEEEHEDIVGGVAWDRHREDIFALLVDRWSLPQGACCFLYSPSDQSACLFRLDRVRLEEFWRKNLQSPNETDICHGTPAYSYLLLSSWVGSSNSGQAQFCNDSLGEKACYFVQ
jgi:hypothetical protein